MENHPLFQKLRDICVTHEVDEGKAHMAFQSYLELMQGNRFQDLDCHFNVNLKMFYLSGKTDSQTTSDIYVPVMLTDELSSQDMEHLHSELSPIQRRIHLIIRDRDSSSTCYRITSGLIPPDSPMESKQKKDQEMQNYQLEQMIQKNRKTLYMKALKKS